MPNPKHLIPKEGVTSAQAAALYITDGRTDDPKVANRAREVDVEAGEHNFYFDALDRDHLVKTIGFPFDVVIKHKKLTVFARDKPEITKTVKFSGIENEQMVEKLVALCLDVKKMYEEQKQKDLLEFVSDPKTIKAAAEESMEKRQALIDRNGNE